MLADPNPIEKGQGIGLKPQAISGTGRTNPGRGAQTGEGTVSDLFLTVILVGLTNGAVS